MDFTYQEVTDPRVARNAFQRRRRDVTALEGLGFRRLAVVDERSRGVLAFLAVPLMLAKRESWSIGRDLRVVVRSPLLVSGDRITIALVFARGVKFYTEYSDGSVLITGNFSSAVRGEWPEKRLYKYGERPTDLDTAYAEHRAHQAALSSPERTMRSGADFTAYVRMSERETRSPDVDCPRERDSGG